MMLVMLVFQRLPLLTFARVSWGRNPDKTLMPSCSP